MAILQDLIGKICTVNTVEVNFRFKPEQMMDYFMGTVESIDDEFIWLIHPQTKCRTAVARKYIVCIAEEQVLFESIPEHAKIIEEYRQEKPITASKTTIPAQQQTPYVNVKELS